jgi:hypothetical protein
MDTTTLLILIIVILTVAVGMAVVGGINPT